MQIRAGTRAVVTGASRGIGRAVARALAERGATVGLAARSREELERLAAELPGAHDVLACDVGDAASVAAAVEAFGAVDLLVANAGIAHYGPFASLPLEQAEAMTQINWLGTVHAVRAALPGMLARRRGHVVIVSSGAGLRSFPAAAVYGATKAAQRGFGEALRHELAGTGVGLTLVYPGEIASSLHHHEDAMPPWYRGGPDAAPAEDLASALIGAVERNDRALYFPKLVRLLGIAHGLSPVLGDVLMRVLRGRTAAPRL